MKKIVLVGALFLSLSVANALPPQESAAVQDCGMLLTSLPKPHLTVVPPSGEPLLKLIASRVNINTKGSQPAVQVTYVDRALDTHVTDIEVDGKSVEADYKSMPLVRFKIRISEVKNGIIKGRRISGTSGAAEYKAGFPENELTTSYMQVTRNRKSPKDGDELSGYATNQLVLISREFRPDPGYSVEQLQEVMRNAEIHEVVMRIRNLQQDRAYVDYLSIDQANNVTVLDSDWIGFSKDLGSLLKVRIELQKKQSPGQDPVIYGVLARNIIGILDDDGQSLYIKAQRNN